MSREATLFDVPLQQDSLSALDQLFSDTRAYRTSREYLNLLRFTRRFSTYAPFNCFLLWMQQPGARYVATSEQWRRRFKRGIKDGARPLVILAPMSPVLFVYDVTDTEGEAVPPEMIDPFKAKGFVPAAVWRRTLENCPRDLIKVVEQEMHPNSAGSIGPGASGDSVDLKLAKVQDGRWIYERRAARYRLTLNAKQELPARYATLAHELAHLYCGHLGTPNKDWWPDRAAEPNDVQEFEAESIAYLVCGRLGIANPSARYLSEYLTTKHEVPKISLECVLGVAGQIEKMGRGVAKPRKEKP